ncbi:LOW QUALITY PROTEIN: neuronal membrane glycoprotein M6-a-like [Ptychodera flava]|uniref:LOW QUALITY PROTEIN: neuronal membrane glycoprotein M6-a-like n=1 Tax=Ptychodera flava TaxID=63121 RepID=UPI00396AAC01
MGCFDCLALTPFASLIATIVLAVGVGLFCGCGLYALDATCKLFSDYDLYLCDCAERAADTNFETLKLYLYWTIIGVTAFMGVWAIILLVLSFLSTYKAKTQVYGGETVVCGGYICNAFFIFLNYILTLVWLLAAAASSVPIVYLLIFNYSIYCIEDSALAPNEGLNLVHYGVALDNDIGNGTGGGCEGNSVVEKTELENFESATDLQLWWGLFFAATCLVVIGLIHFMMCMSANYAYVKAGLKKSDYEEKKFQEEQELNDLSAFRSSDRIAHYPY